MNKEELKDIDTLVKMYTNELVLNIRVDIASYSNLTPKQTKDLLEIVSKYKI